MLITQGYQPILSRDSLFCRDSRYADTRRFAAQFKSAWRRLPASARNTLLINWRDYQSNAGPHVPCPHIEIGLVAAEGQVFGSEWFAAGYFHDLKRFCFWAPVVNLIPDELLQTLIAHELGHAYYGSRGETEDEEPWVRQHVQDEWGFNEVALTNWLANDREAFQLEYQRLLQQPRRHNSTAAQWLASEKIATE